MAGVSPMATSFQNVFSSDAPGLAPGSGAAPAGRIMYTSIAASLPAPRVSTGYIVADEKSSLPPTLMVARTE